MTKLSTSPESSQVHCDLGNNWIVRRLVNSVVPQLVDQHGYLGWSTSLAHSAAVVAIVSTTKTHISSHSWDIDWIWLVVWWLVVGRTMGIHSYTLPRCVCQDGISKVWVWVCIWQPTIHMCHNLKGHASMCLLQVLIVHWNWTHLVPSCVARSPIARCPTVVRRVAHVVTARSTWCSWGVWLVFGYSITREK